MWRQYFCYSLVFGVFKVNTYIPTVQRGDIVVVIKNLPMASFLRH